MHWDIEHLKNKLNQLAALISQTDNEEELIKIKFDIFAINYMLNCSNKNYSKMNNIVEYYSIFNYFYDKNRDIDTISHLNKNLESLIVNSVIKTDGLKIKKYLFLKHNIKLEEYIELINSFLLYYNLDFYNIFSNMQKKNSIEMLSNFNLKSAKGYNMHLCSDSSNYIYAKYLNNIDYFSVLVHELTHAYQYNNVYNLKEHFNKSNSVFREAYPIFTEYAFADYLSKSKEEKYKKLGYELESVLLDNFILTIENISAKLISFNKKNSGISYNKDKRLIMLFYSDLLALYFLDEYRKDRDNSQFILDDFNKNIGIKKDSELLERFNNCVLQKSLSNTINRYLKR